MGQRQRKIVQGEKCGREAAARTVPLPEVQNFVAQVQQEFFGLVPDAIAAMRYALQIEKNAQVALYIVQGTGVGPYRNERLQLPQTLEQRYRRQVEGIANAIWESHLNLGVELTEEMKKEVADANAADAAAARQTSAVGKAP